MPSLGQILQGCKDWIPYLNTISIKEQAPINDLKKILFKEGPDSVLVVGQNGEPKYFIPADKKNFVIPGLAGCQSISDLKLPHVMVMAEELDIRELDALLVNTSALETRFFLMTRGGMPFGLLAENHLLKAIAAAMALREEQEFNLRKEMKKMRESLDFTLHDIKGPMTIISHCAHLLEMAGNQEIKSKDLIQKILINSSKIIELASGFLRAGQISAGYYKGVRIWTDAESFVQQSVDDLADVAALKGTSIRVGKINRGKIFIDKGLMTRALQNLIENAIKHSQPQSIVEVTGGANVLNGVPHFLIHVKDQGPGIPHHQMDEIFKAFKQVGSGQQDLIPGVGLGLTIASKFTEAHGGWLEVRNNTDRGATFSMVIPNFEEELTTDRLKRFNEKSGRQLHILVVDDDPDIVDYVVETIRELGQIAIGVANPVDALQEIRDHKPDLALIDIKMPGMSGLELLEAMQTEGLATPAYLFSGKYPEETAFQLARDNGAEGFLNKPLEIAKLQPVINKYFNKVIN